VNKNLLSALLLSLSASLAHATVVQNFEGGTIAPGAPVAPYTDQGPCSGGGTLYGEGTMAVTSNIAACHNLWLPVGAQEGTQFLAVNGALAVGPVYEQTITGLTIGSTYLLSGYFAGLYTINPANITWGITAGGAAPVNSFLTNTTGAWESNGISFVATGSSVTFNIGIYTTEQSGNDFGVDNITIEETESAAVPEPASMMLVGLGLAVVGLARRKR
jgi:hypothetical protein